MALLQWIKNKFSSLSAYDQKLAPGIEAAERLLDEDPYSALETLPKGFPEDPELLARALDVKILAALRLRDLLALEGASLHAQTLAELLPEKAREHMLEAEAIGAWELAKALAEGISASGAPAAEDLIRIQEKKSRRFDGQSFLKQAQHFLGKSYEDFRLVGVGKQGFVLSVQPKSGGPRLAAKFLGPRAYLDKHGKARFEREVELLRKLDHPGVLRVHDWHFDDPPFVLCEFFPGPDLRSILDQGRVFTSREIARIGTLLADAVAHAHSKGVIHRNVQPANVLINFRNEIKLIDFGMAKLEAQAGVSVDGMVLGDWAYLSPEQFHGLSEVRPEVDVFGIGATLYHLATHRPPFSRGKGLLRDRGPSAESLNPGLSPDLATLIDESLRQDPMERPANAEVLRNRLRNMV